MATFVNEPFTAADSTAVETLPGWSEHATFTAAIGLISTNRLRNSTTGTAPGCWVNSGAPILPNYYVESVIRCISTVGTQNGPAGRIDTAADTMYHIDSLAGSWRLCKRVAGVLTTLATSTETLVGATDYTVRLRMIEDQIRGDINGVERLQATDTAITAAGKAGVMAISTQSSGAGVHVDSLVAVDYDSLLGNPMVASF